MPVPERPVLVAPDSFKGTFSAPQVAGAIGRGLERAGLMPPDLCPVADGGEGTLDALLGNLPGNSSTANLVRSDFPQLQANRALQLSDLPTIVPIRPTSPAVPGGQVAIYNRGTNFTAYDPEFATPYTENYTLSVARQLARNATLEVKYIGVLSAGS